MASSSSFSVDHRFSLLSRSSVAPGTFLYSRDATGENVEHWLALAEAVRVRDLAGIVEHLPLASGTLSTRTRNNTVRKGRLPRRVDALLDGSPRFLEHLRQRAERSPRWPNDPPRAVEDVPRHLNALDLLVWVAPDLVAPMLAESHRAAQREPRAYQADRRSPVRWIGDTGRLYERLAAGGVNGRDDAQDPWNPHWPAIVGALAIACLDRFGEVLQRDSTTRDDGRTVYGQRDHHLASWLHDNLPRGITRQDDEAIGRNLRSSPLFRTAMEDAMEEGERPVTVWHHALRTVLERGDREHWDLPTWQGWARRWILATDTQALPERCAAEVAQAFWQRWPDERLPLRRSDSVAPATLLRHPDVFTDEKLADWLLHGEGSVLRTAQCSGTRWALLNETTWVSSGRQPWTWMEWCVELDRVGVAQRLAHAGWTLIEGFESTYLPTTLPPYLPAEERNTWPARRQTRCDRVEAVRLTESAYDAAPSPQARSRSRL